MTRTAPSRLALVAVVLLVVGACSSGDPNGRSDAAVVVGADLDATPPPADDGSVAPTTAVPVTPAPDQPAVPTTALPPVVEPLLLGTARGVVALDPEAGRVINAEPAALASPDGRWLVQARIAGETTEVVVLDAATGATVASQTVDGRWAPRVVSADGRRVVLGPTGSYTDGRDRTSLLAVEPGAGAEPRDLYLVGNLEPEAFSSDGRALFVLQYSPPLAPTEYRVRRLDLATGGVEDVPDKGSGWADAMSGTARTHAFAPDGRRLYTLYTTGDPAAGDATAFVHVLDLDEQWAFCVFLPVPMGVAGGGHKMTIAVSPDSSKAYVADLDGGAVAVVDAATLTVSAMSQLTSLLPSDSPATSTVAPDGTVWIGQGNAAISLTADLTGWAHGAFAAREAVTGVALAPDGHRLYLGLTDAVQVLDVRDGRELALLDAPGIGPLTGLDPSAPPLDPARSSLSCTIITPVGAGPGALARSAVPRC